MPRKPRGGGQPNGYSNRSDLRETQPVQTPKNQPYGDRKKSEQAQQAVPLPNAAGQNNLMQRALQAAQADPRGAQAGAFAAPTAKPDEPLTAGVPIGPGPGANPLAPLAIDEPLEVLRGLFQASHLEEIRELIDMAEAQNSNAAPIEPTGSAP